MWKAFPYHDVIIITVEMEFRSQECIEQEELQKDIDDEEDLDEHVEDNQVIPLPAATADTTGTRQAGL